MIQNLDAFTHEISIDTHIENDEWNDEMKKYLKGTQTLLL